MSSRRAGAIAALAAVATVTAAGTAAADPRIDLDRCDALDRTALRRAVDAELAGLAADKRAAVGDRVVVVTCPDAVTAHLQLEPVPATGPIARSLDLGEVPGELRARLIALAVVEVVEIAALISAGVITAPSREPGPTADRPSGIDPAPLVDRTPGGTPPRDEPIASPGGAPGGVTDGSGVTSATTAAAAAAPLATRRALGDGPDILRGRAIAPRVGLRIYAANAVPMLAIALDVLQGALAFGITGAIGQTEDPLGTVRPYLLAATAGVTVACARRGALEACASGRVTAGLAAVTAAAADPGIASNSATAPYLELGGQLELAWRGRHKAGVLAIDAGWAEGLVATAAMREAARLDGAVIVATIGARW